MSSWSGVAGASGCRSGLPSPRKGSLSPCTTSIPRLWTSGMGAVRAAVYILRPFNSVGIGEQRALGDVEALSGNLKQAMSHVVPDLVQKVLKGQDPLPILGDGTQVRHYTYGGDLARGIVDAMEHPSARNEDFNLSTAQSTSVLELAETGVRKIRDPHVPFRWVSDPPFEHDVQKRIPAVEKAERMLGFRAPPASIRCSTR